MRSGTQDKPQSMVRGILTAAAFALFCLLPVQSQAITCPGGLNCPVPTGHALANAYCGSRNECVQTCPNGYSISGGACVLSTYTGTSYMCGTYWSLPDSSSGSPGTVADQCQLAICNSNQVIASGFPQWLQCECASGYTWSGGACVSSGGGSGSGSGPPSCAPPDNYSPSSTGNQSIPPIYNLYVAGGGGYPNMFGSCSNGATSGWRYVSSGGTDTVSGGTCTYTDACDQASCPAGSWTCTHSLVRIYSSCTCTATPTPAPTPDCSYDCSVFNVSNPPGGQGGCSLNLSDPCQTTTSNHFDGPANSCSCEDYTQTCPISNGACEVSTGTSCTNVCSVTTPVLSFSPNTGTFPATAVGSSSNLSVQLRNAGPGTATGCTLSLTGPNATSFSISPATCPSISSGGFCALTLTATPVNPPGTKTVQIHAACNTGSAVADSGNFTVSTPACGTYGCAECGTGAYIAGNFCYDNSICDGSDPTPAVTFGPVCVSGLRCSCYGQAANTYPICQVDSSCGSTPTPPPPSVSISFAPAGHDFGNITTGSVSGPQTITITNNAGSIALSSCVVSMSTGEFSVAEVVAGSCATLAPATNCAVNVRGAPTTSGLKTGSIRIQCAENGAGNLSGPPFFRVIGTGPPATPPPPCDLAPGDCNRGAGCTCNGDYIKVALPSGMPAPPCGSITVATLQNSVREAIARQDYQLVDILKSVLDAVCPSAFAQTNVTCNSSDGICAKDIMELCPGDNCSKNIRYTYNGAAPPPACSPAPPNCTVSINCQAWTTGVTSSERICKIDDPCFGKTGSCFPFNHSSFMGTLNQSGTSGDVKQVGTDNSGANSPGTSVCIPNCENFNGWTNTGLKYVWAGPNQGKCACPIGYVWNSSTHKCVSPLNLLGCDAGGISGFPSEVSPYIPGSNYVTRFNNTINKKLNCCLNGMGTTATMAKFDCVDNTFSFSSNFDNLWSSSDPAGDGGQLNAILLIGPNGKPITGFYSLDGKRADNYSEFTNQTIQPGKVSAKFNPGQVQQVAGGFQAVGPAVPKPSGAAWTEMVTKIGKGIPATAQEKRDYPILVRAAAVYHCPPNPVTLNSPLKSRETYSGGNLTAATCATAATVTIHIQIKQIWEIAGTKTLQTIDSAVDQSQSANISVDQMIVDKYGPGCGPGRVLQGSACVW